MTEPEILDPYCNPDAPIAITFDDITSAAYRVKSGVKYTECTKSEHLSNLTGMEIYLKREFTQATGSFKERGARNCMMMMPPETKSKGIVAASAGNHALACCYVGLSLGIPVTVVMPVTSPIMKIEKCKSYKGNVIVEGKTLAESKYIAQAYARDKGMMYLNGYDHQHVLAGQGTIGLEIWEQVQGLGAVIVPVGGGGLISGICVAIKALDPKITVIGVEPERAPCLTEAFKAGKPVNIKVDSTLADGLAVAKIGVNSFETVRKILDKVVTVKEQYIALAILRMVEYEKCVVEGAGATPLGSILQGLVPELRGKKVCLILSGGNIDTTVLGRVLDRGLAADGRLVKVQLNISDRVGGMQDLTRDIESLGVHIRLIVHERAWVIEDVFQVRVKVICECRDREHSLILRDNLANKYGSIHFNGQLFPGDDMSRPTSVFAGAPSQQQRTPRMGEKPSGSVQESVQQVTDFEVKSVTGSVQQAPQTVASFPSPQPGGYSPYLQPNAAPPVDQKDSQAGSQIPSSHPSQQAAAPNAPPMAEQKISQIGTQIGSSHPSQQLPAQGSQHPSNVPPLGDQKSSQVGPQLGSAHPSQQSTKNDVALMKPYSNCACKKRTAPGDYQK